MTMWGPTRNDWMTLIAVIMSLTFIVSILVWELGKWLIR